MLTNLTSHRLKRLKGMTDKYPTAGKLWRQLTKINIIRSTKTLHQSLKATWLNRIFGQRQLRRSTRLPGIAGDQPHSNDNNKFFLSFSSSNSLFRTPFASLSVCLFRGFLSLGSPYEKILKKKKKKETKEKTQSTKNHHIYPLWEFLCFSSELSSNSWSFVVFSFYWCNNLLHFFFSFYESCDDAVVFINISSYDLSFFLEKFWNCYKLL